MNYVKTQTEEKIMGHHKPTYRGTNESIKAILTGMNISQKDSILAIMGSGQQGLAMAGQGAKVDLIDYDGKQRGYVNRILKFLKNKENSDENCGRILMNIGFFKKEYFNGLENIIKIRENIDKINTLGNGDIFDTGFPIIKYNKFYLSNAATYHCSEKEAIKKLRKFVKKIGYNSLIYLAQKVFNEEDLIKYELREEEELSAKALKEELLWHPQVLIKEKRSLVSKL